MQTAGTGNLLLNVIPAIVRTSSLMDTCAHSSSPVQTHNYLNKQKSSLTDKTLLENLPFEQKLNIIRE